VPLLEELVQVAFSQRRKLLRHTLAGAWLTAASISRGEFDAAAPGRRGARRRTFESALAHRAVKARLRVQRCGHASLCTAPMDAAQLSGLVVQAQAAASR
jgi:16S rRNA A1518/A1519 N6-dimethyltransferase RsmA/KsgA/DIM1 with predicted DNA glycosylase/AP lyase activity